MPRRSVGPHLLIFAAAQQGAARRPVGPFLITIIIHVDAFLVVCGILQQTRDIDQMLNQYWINAGPPSGTLAQH